MYHDIYNCICQNTKKIRFIIQYVKPTAQLLFRIRFPKGGPTCRRQVVNPRHQTPQGQSVAKPETPGGGGYSSSSRAGRPGRTLWPQNSTSVAETEKGGQNSTMTPPTLEKGGQYSTSVWKVCKKGGSKIYNSKKYRGQNSTSLKMGVKILHAEK